MEYRFNLAELFTRHNLDQKILFIHIVGDMQVDQIDKLSAVFQVVHHQDIGDAFVIQGFNDIAADKTRAASDDDHNCTFAK